MKRFHWTGPLPDGPITAADLRRKLDQEKGERGAAAAALAGKANEQYRELRRLTVENAAERQREDDLRRLRGEHARALAQLEQQRKAGTIDYREYLSRLKDIEQRRLQAGEHQRRETEAATLSERLSSMAPFERVQPPLGPELDPASEPPAAKRKRIYPPKGRTTRPVKERTPAEKEVQEGVANLLRQHGWLVTRFNSGGGYRGHQGERFVFNYIIYGFVLWCNRTPFMIQTKDGMKLSKHRARNGEGYPDLTAFRGDRFLMIEVKRKKGKIREAQKLFAEFARQYGITVHSFDSWEQARDFVDRMERR